MGKLSLVVAVGLVCAVARADRGSIPFEQNVRIFEPTQRAMIAWNGEEEILLLSTDLRASAPTRVLEVLPLPAEPVVAKGDVEVFRRATALINAQQRRVKSRARGISDGANAAPAGRVTFHEKIGAQDITVAEVVDAAAFVDWAQRLLSKHGAKAGLSIPEPLREVIGEYLRDGYTWFVFAVVDLDASAKTQEAVQYRFRSDKLYYPLRITRTEVGDTSVELLILTPKLLRDFPGLPIRRINLQHDPVSLTRKQLRGLNEEMDDLLGSKPTNRLRIWKIRGALSSFEQDLLAR